MSLKEYSIEELKSEIERREQDNIPKPISAPDWSPVIETCVSHITEIANGDYDTDGKHWVYESAMEAVFGESVWTWINSNTP